MCGLSSRGTALPCPSDPFQGVRRLGSSCPVAGSTVPKPRFGVPNTRNLNLFTLGPFQSLLASQEVTCALPGAREDREDARPVATAPPSAQVSISQERGRHSGDPQGGRWETVPEGSGASFWGGRHWGQNVEELHQAPSSGRGSPGAGRMDYYSKLGLFIANKVLDLRRIFRTSNLKKI